MADYPLAELNASFTESEGERIGLIFECPNCGVMGGVNFEGTEYQKKHAAEPSWAKTGDTLDVVSLTPSVHMIGHFHSWIKGGKLCVDSPFSCEAKTKEGN